MVNCRTLQCRHWFLSIAVCLVLLAVSSVAIAAQGTTASIIGRVTDESGAVLPGVTISATSPALQLPAVVDVTDASGEYRLTPLPIGTYVVEYALAGFQPIRHENLRLTTGFVAKVDVVLKIGALAETITVSGAAPVVDVTSTTTSFQMTREALELLPTTRNGIIGLLNQTPGVRSNLDIGGSGVNAGPIVRAYGQGGAMYFTVEGVVTTGASFSTGGGQYFDYSVLEEAQIQTLGGDAEVPSRGVQVNMLVKSGGNDFHANASWHQTNQNFQSKNIDAALAAQRIRQGNEIQNRWDVSGDFGGRIVRDKLWFYLGARKRAETQNVLGFTLPDGQPGGSDQSTSYATGKLSYQMTKANRLVGFYQRNYKLDIHIQNEFSTWESRENHHPLVLVNKIEWQSVLSNSLVATAQAGYWSAVSGHLEGHTAKPATLDRANGAETGEWIRSGWQGTPLVRTHFKGTVTWYRPDLLGGSHGLKTGFDYMPGWASESTIHRLGTNYQVVFNNGVPLQLVTWNTPTYAREDGRYLAFYGQDSWTIGRRLTLNLGVRYAHDVAFIAARCRDAADPPGQVLFPAQCFPRVNFNTWNPVSPRVRAAYDMTGDGKTVIKGGWGRFAHMRNASTELRPANPGGRVTATYRWRDLNGNRDYDLGEVNLDPQGPDFVSRAGGITSVPNPNEREPYTDEFSVTVERELVANMSVQATGAYTRNSDIYRTVNILRPPDVYSNPVTRPDPGPDGRLGTADDPGTSITYYEYPAAVAGARFERFMLTNDPEATQTFKTIEFLTQKRLSNDWLFTASYSATKTNNPLVSGLNPGEGSSPIYAADANPNAEIFSHDRNWEWIARGQGAYYFPADLMVSANYSHLSGAPWARQVLFTGGVLSSVTLRVEPIGSRRLPNRNIVDLRVAKGIRLRNSHRAEIRLNVYNVLNTNSAIGMTALSGANFMRPTGIVPPRILELGAAYSF